MWEYVGWFLYFCGYMATIVCIAPIPWGRMRKFENGKLRVQWVEVCAAVYSVAKVTSLFAGFILAGWQLMVGIFSFTLPTLLRLIGIGLLYWFVSHHTPKFPDYFTENSRSMAQKK